VPGSAILAPVSADHCELSNQWCDEAAGRPCLGDGSAGGLEPPLVPGESDGCQRCKEGWGVLCREGPGVPIPYDAALTTSVDLSGAVGYNRHLCRTPGVRAAGGDSNEICLYDGARGVSESC
jgi:hypothetical protein